MGLLVVRATVNVEGLAPGDTGTIEDNDVTQALLADGRLVLLDGPPPDEDGAEANEADPALASRPRPPRRVHRPDEDD